MTKQTLDAAEQAARKFLEAVTFLRDDTTARNVGTEFRYNLHTGTAASGAVRYRSMILTRALAKMRRP